MLGIRLAVLLAHQFDHVTNVIYPVGQDILRTICYPLTQNLRRPKPHAQAKISGHACRLPGCLIISMGEEVSGYRKMFEYSSRMG